DSEFRLAHVAQWAAPVIGDVAKARTRRDAFFGQAVFLVVDPAANQADPALVFDHFTHDTHSSSNQCTIRTVCPFMVHPTATRNITGIPRKDLAARSVYRSKSRRRDVQPDDSMSGRHRTSVYPLTGMRPCRRRERCRIHRAAIAKEKTMLKKNGL